MSELSNYRAVGLFDLLSAPVTPIGAFDAEQFKSDVKPLLEKGSKFVAVDLTGIDFLYSDACSAFKQIQADLSAKEGSFGILSDNDIVADCLKKAGLDKTLRIFRRESDMLAFSMKEDSLQHEESKPEPEAERTSTPLTGSRHRVTGRFTKSFNAIRKDDEPMKGSLSDPFEEQKSSGKTWLWIVLAVAVVAGVGAFIALS